MTDVLPDLDSDTRTAIRAFLQSIRDGDTAEFENRRGGDANEQTHDVGGGVTVAVRETWDGALELDIDLTDSDSAGPVGRTALADTLVTALNDTFDDADISPGAFETTFTPRVYRIVYPLPSIIRE